MAVDEQSSQDSTLIDDDLVAALGFEPVTTMDAEPSTGETRNGDVASSGDTAVDVADGDVSLDEISTNGDHDGFGVDEIDAVADAASADVDVPGEDTLVDDVSVDAEERGSFFDLDSSESETIEVGADAVVHASVPIADDGADVASVPSIASAELDADATAPVDLIALDTENSDIGVADIGNAGVGELDIPAFDGDVIDLDTVDLSDASASDDVADLAVQELADADSVFADATPVLDPPAFDEPIGHPPTETVDQVGPGLLDLDAAPEAVGTAAVATAATATATKGRRRLRARKSRRVIRHIDPWSVLTFSVLFHMVVFAALLLSSVLVWNAAIASGMVENVESFIQELGDYETFEINADVMFRAAIVIAGMLTLASSVLVVLLTVVFNLISDLVGGIRVTVIEEETVRVPIDKKRSKARNE